MTNSPSVAAAAQHPITPPPELVEQWRNSPEYTDGKRKLIMVALTTGKLQHIATQAAQWGSDQELEACCKWLRSKTSWSLPIDALRAARRPKPPSLKEQALEELDELLAAVKQLGIFNPPKNIRRALKALDD